MVGLWLHGFGFWPGLVCFVLFLYPVAGSGVLCLGFALLCPGFLLHGSGVVLAWLRRGSGHGFGLASGHGSGLVPAWFLVMALAWLPVMAPAWFTCQTRKTINKQLSKR